MHLDHLSMSKNLETADKIVKLSLAMAVIVFYFIGVITGPFARALMIMASIVILIFSARIFLARYSKDS